MDEREEIARDFELLARALEKKTEPMHLGAPELVSIDHDDYHADLVGRMSDGRQFFITTPGIPETKQQKRRAFLAVFIFDSSGKFVEAKVDELPAGKDGLGQYDRMVSVRLAELEPKNFGDIKVKPFVTEQHGMMMGLLPSLHGDSWYVVLMPGNFMAFHEPWDSGEYDT